MIQTGPEIPMEQEADAFAPIRNVIRWVFLGALIWLLAVDTVLLVTGHLTLSRLMGQLGFVSSVIVVGWLALASVLIIYRVFLTGGRKPALIEPWGDVANVPEEIRGPEPCGKYRPLYQIRDRETPDPEFTPRLKLMNKPVPSALKPSPSPSSPPVQGGESKDEKAVIASEARQSQFFNPLNRKPWDEADTSLTSPPSTGEGEPVPAHVATAIEAVHEFTKKAGIAVIILTSEEQKQQVIQDAILGAQIRQKIEMAQMDMAKAAGGLH